MQRAPGGNNGQDAYCCGRLTTAKPERRPDQERNTKVLEWIILERGMKGSSEYYPAYQKHSRKQEGKLNHLLPRPIQPGIFSPQEHKGSHNYSADRVSKPPGAPDRSVHRPFYESAQRQAGHTDRGAYRGANHPCEKPKFENVLRPFKRMRATSKTGHQVAAHHAFEGVSNRDAHRGRHGPCGRYVDQERPCQDRRPDAVAQDQEGREGDPRARPYRGRAGIYKGQL